MSKDTTEVRVTSSTGASKGQKSARFDLIPAGPLRALAVHYGVGAQKYAGIAPVSGVGVPIDNWRLGYNFSFSLAAIHRHLNAWQSGEDIDEETGSPHLVAIAWHCFTLMELQSTPGYSEAFDDRQQKLVNSLGATLQSVREAVALYGGTLPESPAAA